MSKFDNIELAEMLNTRFCHDMAGPVSAIANGLTFFLNEDNQDMMNDAKDLLTMSSKEALAKLQTYRMAYGRTDKDAEGDITELRDIVTSFFAYSKLDINWPANSGFDVKIDTDLRRLVVNMILFVSQIMPFGGNLAVLKDGNEIKISGNHSRLKEVPENIAILEGDESIELTPSNVTTFFLKTLSDQVGAQLKLEQNTESVSFIANITAI